MAKAVDEGWTMKHVDVNSAFYNTPLKELIYCMKVTSTRANRVGLAFGGTTVEKSICFASTAPKGWSYLRLLPGFVEDYGFNQCVSDPRIFTHQSIPIMLGLCG